MNLRKAGDTFVVKTGEAIVWMIGLVGLIAGFMSLLELRFVDALFDFASVVVVFKVIYPMIKEGLYEN